MDGEARLADAARPDERQQPHRWIPQSLADLARLGLSSHERRGLGGQLGAAPIERHQWLRDDGQTGHQQLVDTFGPAQVLEAMLAQVADGGALGQLVSHQGGDRGGQQHLASVAGGHDARGAIEGRSEVVAVAKGGLAGMQRHA